MSSFDDICHICADSFHKFPTIEKIRIYIVSHSMIKIMFIYNLSVGMNKSILQTLVTIIKDVLPVIFLKKIRWCYLIIITVDTPRIQHWFFNQIVIQTVYKAFC